MIVLTAVEEAARVQHSELRAFAQRQLEFLAAEEMLDGDTPSSVIVMEPGDPASALSHGLGFDVLATRYSGCRFNESGYSPTFEALVEHPKFFEMVFVLSDYGDGAIVLVPKEKGIDADLLAMCSMHSVPAPAESLP